MAERRVLFFDGRTVTALHWKAGQVDTEGSFVADPVGLEAFAAYLGRHKKSLFHFLADVGDEGFQLETVPYTQGSDRSALIKRRLGQYYYGTHLSAAISLGREKEGRRDEKILFAALTRPEEFTPWLDALRKAAVPLVGLFSAPLVLAAEAPRFIGQREHCLLITLSSSGLRQTYFERGQMQFSRLSQLGSRTAHDIASTCTTEAAKTHQYLVSQRQIKRGTPLPAVIAAHGDLMEFLAGQCRSTEEIQFEIVDLGVVAKNSRFKSPLVESTADPLLAHQLMARPPQQQFAPAEERHLYRLWQLRFGLHGAAIAILSAGLLLGGRFAVQWVELTQNTQTLQQQAVSDNQRYQSLLASLPKIALSPQDLRTAIAGFEQLQKRSGGFEQLLSQLGAALDKVPAIELQRIEWMLTPSFDAKVGAGGTATTAPASPRQASDTKPAAVWFVLDIEGRLPAAMNGDQRTMLDLLDRFAQLLQGDGFKVELTKRPIDVESAKSFKSGNTAATSAAPQFSLRLGRPIAP